MPPRARRTASIALLVTSALFAAQAQALSCETDVAKFDYTDDSPTNFYMGKPEDVDRAYGQLRQTIGPLDSYGKPTVFYSKGYTRVTQHACPGDKCSGKDILAGFQACAAGGMSKADACYPLAVVYRSKLYCLLNPGQADFDPSKKFEPYVPFRD